MDQHISQDEIRRIIISDMVKKRNSIIPVIGEDTIVYTYGVPFVRRWLSYRTLKWIRSAFLDEPSGRSTFGRLQGKKTEREEGLKVMRRYSLLIDISAMVHDVSFFALRTYVNEVMNIGSIVKWGFVFTNYPYIKYRNIKQHTLTRSTLSI